MRRIILAGIFVLAIGPCKAYSTHLNVFSIEEKVRSSQIILIAKITNIRRSLLGFKFASIEPEKLIKGKDIFSNLSVKYGEPFYCGIFFFCKGLNDRTHFEKGKRYVLFLLSDGYHYFTFQTSQGYYLIEKDDKVYFNGGLISLNEFKNIIEKEINPTSP